MEFLYNCEASINEYGDVMFHMVAEQQLFSFRASLSDLVLPQFFSDITALLKGEVSSFDVDGFSMMTYYQFKRNSEKIRITSKDRHIRETYEFKLYHFCKALQIGFRHFFRQQRLKGELEANENSMVEWRKFNEAVRSY